LGLLAAGIVAAVLCLRTGRRYPGGFGLGWTLFAASAIAFSAAQVLWTWYQLGRGDAVPFPSLADIGFFAQIPLMFAALLVLYRARGGPRSDAKALLDACITAAAVLLVSWVLVFGAIYRTNSGPLLRRTLALAYPAGDVALASLALVLAGQAAW